MYFISGHTPVQDLATHPPNEHMHVQTHKTTITGKNAHKHTDTLTHPAHTALQSTFKFYCKQKSNRFSGNLNVDRGTQFNLHSTLVSLFRNRVLQTNYGDSTIQYNVFLIKYQIGVIMFRFSFFALFLHPSIVSLVR